MKVFNQSLTDFLSINCLTVYRAYIVHEKEPIYEFSKESENFHKFTKYCLFSTLKALYILILVSFIYLIKEKLV